jgi:hypothetical protein
MGWDLDEAIGRGWRFIERGEDLLIWANCLAQVTKHQVQKLTRVDTPPASPGETRFLRSHIFMPYQGALQSRGKKCLTAAKNQPTF